MRQLCPRTCPEGSRRGRQHQRSRP
jgi:hypothetical protein